MEAGIAANNPSYRVGVSGTVRCCAGSHLRATAAAFVAALSDAVSAAPAKPAGGSERGAEPMG